MIETQFMILFKKNIFSISLKAFCLLLFISFFPIKSIGQDFDWVYSPKGVVGENEYVPYTVVRLIAISESNEVYATGHLLGVNDFGEGSEEIILNGNNSATSTFLVKLDENKNVIWTKHWNTGGVYLFSSIILDENGNIIICGQAKPLISSLYFNPNPPNPAFPRIVLPTHQDLSNERYYGFVLKLDAQGNYIKTILFNDTLINDIVIDENNDIAAVGLTITYTDDPLIAYIVEWGYFTKLDNNLNLILEKKFNNQNSNSYNGFTNIEVDSQNNMYCSGFFKNSFNYNNTVLEQPPSGVYDNYQFICKILPDNTEDWIINMLDYTVPDMHINESDNIYFTTTYTENQPIAFNNTIINNLPLVAGLGYDSAIFKIDINANHIWNVPIYGTSDQSLTKFSINNLDELILPIKLGAFNELYYNNPNTTVETNNSTSLLLKVNSSGALVDFKRLYENTLQGLVNINTIHVDSNDNILIGGSFRNQTDFDPHPLYEHILSNDLFENGTMGAIYNETRSYVLKLSPCDIQPLFGNYYDFCYNVTSNPAIKDIKPKLLNVKWYSSMISPTPLNDDFEIVDGQTYYYENIVENCSNFQRLPVVMNILPPPPPPIIDVVQPCFIQSLALEDLNITGQNLLFYSSLTGDAIDPSTLIIPNFTYYVSQTISICESQRIPLVLPDYFGSSPNEHLVFFCKSNPNDVNEIVNLSDYNSVFIPVGAVESQYLFSYHHSLEDANQNSNGITNFQNYQATIETIYMRIFSTESLCFKITQLIIDFSSPPIIEKIVTADWSNNNTITVQPNNIDFFYSLDGTTYQNSNYFENLEAGEYTIYIKNKSGCIGISQKIYLLDYPKFFTPNGDGYNDNWSVNFAQLQDVLNVEIYDRYGKFLISFDKNSSGWNGMHNGKQLPATDYWFRITRVSDTKIVYRGHFSLKR